MRDFIILVLILKFFHIQWSPSKKFKKGFPEIISYECCDYESVDDKSLL